MWKYFECERCGKCCEEAGLPWDPNRSQRIAQFLGISVAELVEKYYGKICSDDKQWESEETKRTPCPFLKFKNMQKSCAIYTVRPEPCELYPLETDFGTCGVECPAAKKFYKRIVNKDKINN
ncbi:MAG: YkgJ family cysteine cluster protein [Candidatus Omnitrophota bacterium]